jgi:hypothetical protein
MTSNSAPLLPQAQEKAEITYQRQISTIRIARQAARARRKQRRREMCVLQPQL